MRRVVRLLATSVMIPALALGAASTRLVAQSRKPSTLPPGATEPVSTANVVPGFMVLLDEGGGVPSEPKSTCDNQVAGNSKSTVGIHLEHYQADAKMVFDQKIGVVKLSTVKQAAELEGGANTVAVAEMLDGSSAAYYVSKGACVMDANPSSNRINYFVRLIRDTTYAEIQISLYAANVDTARKYAKDMLNKVIALDYNSIK